MKCGNFPASGGRKVHLPFPMQRRQQTDGYSFLILNKTGDRDCPLILQSKEAHKKHNPGVASFQFSQKQRCHSQ
jgi:hypothetical protein